MKADMEKYTVAFYQQRLRNHKEAMLRAKPGSKAHTAAVIKFDRLRVDLECTMSQLGLSTRRKRGVLSSGQNNTLPFVYKPL